MYRRVRQGGTISTTTWFASEYGISPANDPRPAMRNRPELYTRIRSAPPFSAALADSPMPVSLALSGKRRRRGTSAGADDDGAGGYGLVQTGEELVAGGWHDIGKWFSSSRSIVE
jgi:hypothetical protein